MATSIDLKNRTVLITGAGGGIGGPTAQFIAEAGANVIVAEGPQGREAGEKTHQQIQEAGGSSLFVECDVLDDASCADAVRLGEQHFGPIDSLCYIAGVVSTLGLDAPFTALRDSPEYITSWMGQYDIHVGGPKRFADLLLPGMLERRNGMFLIMSSIAAELTAFGKFPYNASKGAATNFASTLANTYGHQGIVAIPIMPNRVGTPSARARADSSPAAAADMNSTQLSGDMIDPGNVARGFLYLLWNGAAHNGDHFEMTDGARCGLRPTFQSLQAALVGAE